MAKAKASFTMRLSEDEREMFTNLAEREGRTRTSLFLWLLKRRQKELDSREDH